MILLVLALSACSFQASSKVGGDDTAGSDTSAPSDDTGGADSSTDSGADTGTDTDTGPPPDPDDLDDDGDGYTENQGDCDDADPTVAPGIADACDGADDDCDGEIDEDAVDDDPNEPNDTEDTELGTLLDGEVTSVSGLLTNDDDIDRFSFDFEDSSWTLFTLTVTLSGIPTGADYRLTLEYLDGDTVIGQEDGGDDLTISLDDTTFSEDGGTYRVTVDAPSGADCGERYLVSLDFEETF